MSLEVALTQRVDCAAVVVIAKQACQAILAVYNSEAESWDVEHKADESPLTRADREANAVICEGLARIAPHIPIVSEENRQVAYDTRKGYQYSWCVDPLDGTKEFLKRNGQFTVNIALLRGSQPVLGVVAVPVDGTVYWAAEGQGAYVQRPGGEAQRLQAAEVDLSAPGLVVVGSASHLTAETQAFVAQLREPTFKQLGSSLKLLMVAEGAAHVYPRLAPTSEWDTAAAHVIVTEAGGEVLQAGLCDSKGKPLEDWQAALARQQPVQYNKESPLNPFFVVYGRRQKA
ncbi:3 (2),5 -bisphosphate nucleotidase [Chlorella sorokiniana]|uniref:3'(2'),5'-bisphosphate nucleotidase 1 n=1 Tax=Chlorella sorokiniana TaxID=3076 RepID=A0A2P6U473_CHLSO|nr:3 (2),5 -bisphosphate nucleotidase [Chlorella sorokiniana]|eukprot:PRW61118.1 3 (2),5 -bisphosphate nucleotidase [Chlorella sorokiniana]